MSGEKENKINLLMKDFSALNEILYGCSYATIMKSPLIGKNKKISFIWKCHKCGMYFSNSIENRFDKGHGCPNCTSGGNTRKFERSFENLKPLIFEKCQIKDLNIGQLVKSGKTSHIIDWEWLKNRGVNSPKRVKAKCFSDGCKNLLLTKKRGLNKEVCQIIKHPYCLECSGQKASPEDNLTLYPEYLDIVDNWNYELTPFGPEECLPQSNVRVWLHCPRCGQEYPIDLPKATKLNRRHSCGKKRSLIQLRVFSEIVSMLPNYKVEMEADVLGHEVDVYFPDAKLGIEIDGPHHKSRIENDKRKTEDLAASNVHLVRIRDISLDCAIGKVSDNFWFDFKKSSKPELLLPVIFEALKKLGLGSHHTDLTFKGNKLFAELIKNRRIKYEESLEHNSPLIAKEIHEDEEVDAKYIHNKSGLSLWFKCWNPNHPPYFMQVSDRTDQGLGCFYCSGQKVLESESAGALFPVLLEQIVDDVDLFAYTPFSNRGEEEPKSTKKNSLTWHCGNKGHRPFKKTINERGMGFFIRKGYAKWKGEDGSLLWSQCPDCRNEKGKILIEDNEKSSPRVNWREVYPWLKEWGLDEDLDLVDEYVFTCPNCGAEVRNTVYHQGREPICFNCKMPRKTGAYRMINLPWLEEYYDLERSINPISYLPEYLGMYLICPVCEESRKVTISNMIEANYKDTPPLCKHCSPKANAKYSWFKGWEEVLDSIWLESQGYQNWSSRDYASMKCRVCEKVQSKPPQKWKEKQFTCSKKCESKLE